MKITHTIEASGVTATLSFEASPEALRCPLTDSAGVYSAEELEALLLEQGDQTHRLLSQAVQSFHSSLSISCANFLREQLGRTPSKE